MKINLNSILEDIGKSLTITDSFSLSEMEIQDRRIKFPSDMKIDVLVTNTEDDILVNVKVKGEARVNCTRCLEDFSWLVDIDFTENYEKKNSKFIDQSKCLDISSEIKQHVLLSIPMQAICKADCRGLCPICGCNNNNRACTCQHEAKDPRWDKLQLLLEK